MFGNKYFGATYYPDTYFGPAETVVSSGGAVKKKHTEEYFEGLKAFGKARLGIAKNVSPETIIAPETEVSHETFITDETNISPFIPELSILEPTVIPNLTIEGIEQETDEDILLILALITAHES